ncbi:hypothetical protein [Foetidibacter luteolus]|uniref:hypothetical protein n=1 Tax=Foetidibacter luteolus TaxID=2608880 RepID=UPI00129A61D8|nr:hypothetical protein [Foetidibacter luteolus]
MKKIYVPLLLAVISFTSCQKEISWGDDVITDDGPIVTNPSDTYQPLTAGSTWTYRMHQTFKFDDSMFEGFDFASLGFGSIEEFLEAFGFSSISFDTTIEYTSKCLDKDSTINNKVYRAVQANMGGIERIGYNCRVNGDYYQYGNLVNVSTGTTDIIGLEMLYLKDNMPVGTSWDKTVSLSNGAVTKMVYSIKNRGLSKTVNSITYKDVIQVETIATPQLPAGSPEIPGFDIKSVTNNFFAKNIGLIYQEAKDGLGTTSTVELIKAEIK